MLHYVGFNAYKQCPEVNEKNLPKIIVDWASVPQEGILGISCTHRFLVIEMNKNFSIFGFVIEEQSIPWVIEKPKSKIDCFQSSEECLMVAVGCCLWKLSYKDSKWGKLSLKFSDDDKSVWTDKSNKVVKMSYRTDLRNFIVLLSNGSVWVMADQDRLKLLFPGHVDKAVDLSSGLEHTLILTQSGCVLSFGNGRGQLGTGSLESIDVPVQLSSLEGLKISQISAGHWHSCAITESGDLCTWGWNNFGQLGAFEDGEEIGLSTLPVFVDICEEEENSVVEVACGSRHTVAKLENGDIYSTGWNAYGQLGIQQSSTEKITKFTKVTLEGNPNRKIVVGPWYTILLENQTKVAS